MNQQRIYVHVDGARLWCVPVRAGDRPIDRDPLWRPLTAERPGAYRDGAPVVTWLCSDARPELALKRRQVIIGADLAVLAR